MTPIQAKTIAVAIVMAALGGARLANGQPKGERVTITGEPVDMWCYLEAGDRGPAKKDCATACAKAGNPIGLVDARGDLYVTAALKSHEPARTLLLDKMSEQVTVTGTLVTKDGVKMIYIESVK